MTKSTQLLKLFSNIYCKLIVQNMDQQKTDKSSCRMKIYQESGKKVDERTDLEIVYETIKGFNLPMWPTRNTKFSTLPLQNCQTNFQIFWSFNNRKVKIFRKIFQCKSWYISGCSPFLLLICQTYNLPSQCLIN